MRVIAGLALCVACVACLAARGEAFAFGVFSDTPYSAWERENFGPLIDEMSNQPLDFIVHLGDIKDGSSPCTDANDRFIFEAFQASAHPLVYIPGDNEWTDCFATRRSPSDPLQRLAALRALFWGGDRSLGRRTLTLERQSQREAYAAYRENVRWQREGVLFVGLNLPGSHNNYFGTSNGTPAPVGPSPEFVARSAANRVWLAETFAAARERGLRAIVVLIHANPGFETISSAAPTPAYIAFLAQLRTETLGFKGEVVLFHGDTHRQRIDRPMTHPDTGQTVTSFTRVEGYGPPAFGWIEVRADVQLPGVFSFVLHPWATGSVSPGPGTSPPGRTR